MRPSRRPRAQATRPRGLLDLPTRPAGAHPRGTPAPGACRTPYAGGGAKLAQFGHRTYKLVDFNRIGVMGQPHPDRTADLANAERGEDTVMTGIGEHAHAPLCQVLRGVPR